MKKNTLVAFFWLFLGIQSIAQSLYNNGSIISIGSNTIFSVQDSLVNNGTLTNNGNMVMGGVWLNLGTYNPGTGEITFNSPPGLPQIINHNNQSFSKLTISGGGEKIILADMTIVGELILTDGIIGSENSAKVIFSQGAIISGGSDQSHINATVHQQGTGNKLFPVGSSTKYLPVEITGISQTSEIGITLNEFQTDQTFNSSGLSDVSDQRYWSVDVVSGSLENAKIILPVAGDEGLNMSEIDRFVVALAENSSSDFQSLGRGTGSTSALIESGSSPSTGLVTLALPSEGIVVFNAISPNPDDAINDYIKIENLVETDVVSIYNRWGDLVFEMKDYDNDNVSKRFNGTSNVSGTKDLPTATYFYVIRRKTGDPVSGYISLRR